MPIDWIIFYAGTIMKLRATYFPHPHNHVLKKSFLFTQMLNFIAFDFHKLSFINYFKIQSW